MHVSVVVKFANMLMFMGRVHSITNLSIYLRRLCQQVYRFIVRWITLLHCVCYRFKSDGSGVPKYRDEAKELIRPERNTLEVYIFC